METEKPKNCLHLSLCLALRVDMHIAHVDASIRTLIGRTLIDRTSIFNDGHT